MYLGMTTLSRYQSATGYRHGLGYSIQQNIASIVLDERLVEYRMWNRRDQVFPSCERVDCIVRAMTMALDLGWNSRMPLRRVAGWPSGGRLSNQQIKSSLRNFPRHMVLSVAENPDPPLRHWTWRSGRAAAGSRAQIRKFDVMPTHILIMPRQRAHSPRVKVCKWLCAIFSGQYSTLLMGSSRHQSSRPASRRE